MKDSIVEVFSTTWPIILITLIISIIIRVYFIKTNKLKVVLYEELILISAIVYTMCLFYVVTFPDSSAPWSTSNFIPFKEIFRYEFLSRLFIKNVLGNFFMFIPLAFYLSYIFKIRKFKYIFFLNLLVSLTIELIQLCIGRVFDIDDIILNILGGITGYYIYYLFHLIKNKYENLLNKTIFNNTITIISIILFIIGCIYILMF